ncbi:hypothetical protein [Syntrophotalea carbinolica]|uniref:hypothetical protein n=1 Tax=Syntrophotalea carbinolica TaxID=19 RepID=UPI0005A19D5B|nr:hypothetical protein [Syntrophotalea carbinolica]
MSMRILWDCQLVIANQRRVTTFDRLISFCGLKVISFQRKRLWDGRVRRLQVTDAGERTLQLRALVSAGDSGKCWDLRCEVREKLVDYVQRNHAEALPRLRASLDAPGREDAVDS